MACDFKYVLMARYRMIKKYEKGTYSYADNRFAGKKP